MRVEYRDGGKKEHRGEWSTVVMELLERNDHAAEVRGNKGLNTKEREESMTGGVHATVVGSTCAGNRRGECDLHSTYDRTFAKDFLI